MTRKKMKKLIKAHTRQINQQYGELVVSKDMLTRMSKKQADTAAMAAANAEMIAEIMQELNRHGDQIASLKDSIRQVKKR